jgi:hypothetical protein
MKVKEADTVSIVIEVPTNNKISKDKVIMKIFLIIKVFLFFEP